MECAAALITCAGPGKADQRHVKKAVAGTAQDPLLAQNLKSGFGRENSGSMPALLTGTETARR
jgi:hypothetical protein